MHSSRGSAALRPLRLAVAALALALALSPAAVAKTKGTPVAVTAHAGDKATFTLTGATSRALKKSHIKLQAVKPSSHGKAGYVLPTKSGRWNFTAANGTLNLKGGLRLRMGKHSQTLGTMTFTRGAKGGAQLTIKVHGKKVKIFNMAKKGAKAKNKGTRQTVSKFSVTLTKQAANLINKALKRKVFKAKQKVGSFQVTLTTATTGGPGAPGAPGSAPTSGVGISFVRALDSIPGLSVTPLGSASGGLPAPVGTTPIPAADGTAVTLPVDGSQASLGFDKGTVTGTIPLSGGFQLADGGISATVTNPTLTLGTGTEGSTLSASLNGGPELKLFDIDTTKLLQSATPNGGLSLQGVLAELSSEGATTLNQLFGTSEFTSGQPIGGLSIVLPAQVASSLPTA
jgi:ribosomal protein L21